MTPLGSDALGIPQTGLSVLRDLVHERTGLFFDADRSELLAERVAPLVIERGFRSFLDLYYLLKYDEAASRTAWRQLMDALSVPETYFWREIDQIRAIVCRVVPELASRGAGVIRIWSAPCATGEEPLTIAMALNEAGWFDRLPIEIHGSDASGVAIEKARAGRYRQRAMRAIPPAMLEKYFIADAGTVFASPGAGAAHHVMECGEFDGPRGSGAVRTVPDCLLPQCLHLLLPAGHQEGGRASLANRCRRPATCASARRSRCSASRRPSRSRRSTARSST